jgi:hypothetical protein
MKLFQPFLHPVSELPQEVLEFEDASEHVPIASRLHLAAAELAVPPLDDSGSSICALSLIDLSQLHVKVARCAALLVEIGR